MDDPRIMVTKGHSTFRGLARLRSVSLLGVAQMALLPLINTGLQAQSVPAAVASAPKVNQIIPDGRTQTQLTVNGNVTDITTKTISGAAGFNTFSQFREAAGNTVNLHVPNGANSLVNIVRDGPVVINGILNSYKNGRIGGNVYFSDSQGFIVGSQGVVNVGGLTVNTPTREFLDAVVDKNGKVNDAAASQLMNGNIPISKDGMIAIRGRINAGEGGVKLQGQGVVIAGPSSDTAFTARHHQRMFDASVNTRGLRTGGAIVSRGGSLQIVASGSARIGGTLRTVATRQKPAGAIVVTAANKLTVTSSAKLEAKGYSGKNPSAAASALDGGVVVVKAGNKLTVKDGATFDVSSSKGDAGLVELSSTNTLDIGHVKLNLQAPNGKGGGLLIDPTNIIVGDPTLDSADAGNSAFMSNASVAAAVASTIAGGGTTFMLQADNSLKIDPHGIIDTRRLSGGFSSANALNIELIAPSIEIAAGGQVLARAINTTGANPTQYTNGNVTLTASASQSLIVGAASATTGITVNGIITGKDISINATSNAVSSYTDSTVGKLALVAETLAASLFGLNGGYVAASATANVSVGASANITSSGNVSISASGTEIAEDPAIVFGGAVAASAVVGQIVANVTASVASNATISAGGGFSISATNNARGDVSAVGISTTARFEANVAYLKADVTTSATVATGALITTANGTSAPGTLGSVSVKALNTNSFSVSATSISLATEGGVGASIAMSDINTSAVATFGANLGSSTSKMLGNLNVEAMSLTSRNVSSSSTLFGSPTLTSGLAGSPTTAGFAAAVFPTFGPTFPIAAAGSMALNNTIQTANASIAATDGLTAPSIYATGRVTVVSYLSDAGIHSNAGSSAGAKKEGVVGAISAAVAYGKYTHNSNATIGSGVTLDAYQIGVASTTDVPATNSWLADDSFSAVFSKINLNAGIINNILTSYSNATADSGSTGSLAIAGAVNYFSVDNSTRAWIGSGAHLSASASANLPDTTLQSSAPAQKWSGAIDVVAHAYDASIDIGGNVGTLGLANGTGGGGSSAGGAINFIKLANTTVAGIGANAVVSTPGTLDVSATTSDFIFALAPSSGAAKGSVALNGTTSVTFIDGTTHASIDNSARVSAPTVAINAQENISQWSTSGAVNTGGGSGFGLSVSYLSAMTDTKAYVGGNSADAPSSDTGAASQSGWVHSDVFNVTATTTGRLTAASVAMAESDTRTGSGGFADKLKAVASELSVATQLNDLFDSAGSLEAKTSAPATGFSIDIAGSTSLVFASLDTNAHIAGTTLDRYTSTNTSAAITVQAINNTVIDAGSGSAALNLTATTSAASSAVAGAISMIISGNATRAYIDSTTIDNAKTIAVQALAGGRQVAVGIGLSVGANANAASLAGSVGLISDSANAYISNSNITGSGAVSSRTIDVNAYQTTNIGIGGGSLYFAGGKGGLGVSLTYVSIHDPSGRNAVDAHVSNTGISAFDTLTVIANDSSRISAGAAAGGISANVGFAGAVVVNEISPTITAYIGGPVAYNPKTISLTGTASVLVDSNTVAAYNDALASAALAANEGTAPTDNSGIDFSGSALNGGTAIVGGAAMFSVAGILQGGSSNVGLSLINSVIATTHLAYIADVILNVRNIQVTANDSSTIFGLTIGASFGTGQFSGLAGTTLSSIGNNVTAQIGDATVNAITRIAASGDVSVLATDTSKITSVASVAAFSLGSAAAGLSVAQSSIANVITAMVNNATLTAIHDVSVDAVSTAGIATTAVGIAASRSVGLAGSIALSSVSTDVVASAVSADIIAQNNVGVIASNSDNIVVVAGAAGITVASPSIAGGVSVVTNTIGGNTEALITSNSKVDALGLGTSVLTVSGGDLVTPFDPSTPNGMTTSTPSLAETTRTVHGLAVIAASKQAVVANAVTAGLAIFPVSGAFAVVSIQNTMGGLTKASVDSSLIDTRLTGTAAPQIDISASSHSYSANYIIALAVGGVGGAAANSSNFLKRQTMATLTDSTVGTTTPSYTGAGVDGVDVNASATQAAADVVLGVAAGVGGGAASGVLNSFNADTEAYVSGGSLKAKQLVVNAESTNAFFAEAGTGAAGAVGLASSYIVANTRNTTLATIGRAGTLTTVNLNGKLVVQADSENEFDSLAVGGVAAGGIGLAGMVNIVAVANETRAGLYNVSATQASSARDGANAAGVTVSAIENITIKPTTGAGAASGGFGIGSATNVAVLGSSLTAEIVNTTTAPNALGSPGITSPGTVAVTATGTKTINAQTVTVGAGGSAGIGAAIGVILLGTTASDDANSQINAGGSGTLAAVDATNATGNTLTLSSAGIAAYRTALGASGATMSDQQIQSAAQTEYTALVQNGTAASSTFALSTAALTTYAPRALSSTETAQFTSLTGTGTVTNGVFTLSTTGLSSYRPAAVLALGGSPTDAQVQTYANSQYQSFASTINAYASNRYQTLRSDTVSFVLSQVGIASYRTQAVAGLGLTCASGVQCGTDAQVTTYANDQFQKLTLATNGSVSAGVVTLNTTGLNAFRVAAQADANAKAAALATAIGVAAPNPPATVTDAQVQSYANAQYRFLIGHEDTSTAPQAYSVSAALSKVNDGVFASISGNAPVSAANVNVNATANISTTNYATGVGVGGLGVGAAVAYTRVNDAVAATVTQASINTSALTISARVNDGSTSPAAKVEAHAGAGASIAAVGAAVGEALINNSVTAGLGGSVTLTGAANVLADDTSNIRADAFGATAGGGLALGVSKAVADRTSNVAASLLDASRVTATGLTIGASSEGSSYAAAVAGAGGILLAGTGVQTVANDNSIIAAHVGAGVTVNVGSGDVNITAIDTPDVKAASLGVSVSGSVAVGISLASATASPNVLAQVDGSTSRTDAITAGKLTVSASSVVGSVPTGQSQTATPTSTDEFASGGTSAAAWATAGAGSVYYAGSGTYAVANNNSVVAAKVGDYVNLPVADVVIRADNTTKQLASSTGITVGGVLAVGVVVTDANANTTTTASIGDNVQMLTGGSKAFSLSAVGNDTNTTDSLAGSGGNIAGSGAEAHSANTSTVTASTGNNDNLNVISLLIGAMHSDNYNDSSDTRQAGALGAAGSVAKHTGNSTVAVTIGNGNVLDVYGNSPGSCDISACDPVVRILATNIFANLNTGSSAYAGAGGGINGVGAASTTALTGSNTITIGKSTQIVTGTDPVDNPGSVQIVAVSMISGADRVTLSAGSAIASGAGVNSSLNATIDNIVNIGDPTSTAAADLTTIDSLGNIGIGTYTISSASTSSYANTFGGALTVADALATTRITTNQTVTIGKALLKGVGDVDVAAGQEGSGAFSTSLVDNSSAVSYARGLIAVPVATATTALANNATLNINAGAQLQSGQNINVGAYTGNLVDTATAAGHGFELYAIPVTDGHTHTGSTATASVTINGALTAGIYHDLEISIGCTGGGTTCATPTLQQTSGLTASYLYLDASTFGTGQSYVTNHFDPTVAPTLIAGLPANAGAAFQLGQLYASGGSVNISSSAIAGSGTITAYGAPVINVQNSTTASLILAGGAYIPDTAVGQINFIGAAGPAQVPTTLIRLRPSTGNSLSTIAINNSYDTGFGGAFGPALLITGDIVNVAGLVAINNTSGSYGLAANLAAQQVNITIPNGAVAVSANDPSGLYLAGGSPFSEWNGYILYPGGNPRDGTPNGDVAAAFLANTMYSTNGDQLNESLYGRSYNPGSTRNSSTIFFGGCIPGYGGGDGVGCQRYDTGYGGFAPGSVDNSKTWGFAGSTSNTNNASFPYVTYYSLSKSATSYTSAYLGGSQSSNQIYGGQVAIKANIIDINGLVTAGRNTNWSVNLASGLTDPAIVSRTPVTQTVCAGVFGSSCSQQIVGYNTTYSGGAISVFKAQYDLAVLTNPAANSLLTVNAGSNGSIAATYNAATNTISLANVNASSGGSNVLLDGRIISTNALGHIHVNGGYGNVSITNDTGIDLIVNGINTGNSAAATALTSTVKIVDRLQAALTNTTTYIYSPASSSIRKYTTSNGANPDSSSCIAGNCTTINASTTDYLTLEGTRFQWQLYASLARAQGPYDSATSTNPQLVSAHWRFTSGTDANPWVYVTPTFGFSSTPQGTLLTGQSTSLPIFQERITGQAGSFFGGNASQSQPIAYGGCSGPGSTCNYGFNQNIAVTDSNGNVSYLASWNYSYPISGSLTLTQSIKADNQFQVDFGGNATASLNIASNSNVVFANSIINPSGALTATTRASTQPGNITQTSANPILTGSFDATASGSVGTTTTPLNLTLTSNGATPGGLSARAGVGGVNLNLNSAATLGVVSSGSTNSGFGDVGITATGSLLAGANALVTGRNITLISSAGSVGTLPAPLNISANATPLTSGGYQGGVVNVAAHGDVALVQNAASASYPGDLRIGLIASAAGDVQINVPHGEVLDASGQTSAQALSPAQVSAISQALRLTPLDGSTAASLAVISGFEATVNRDLADYTQLLGNGSLQNGIFVLSAASLEAYRGPATAAIGHAASDIEIQAYANKAYQSYVTDFTRAYGTTWQTNSAVTSYGAYVALTTAGTVINGVFRLNSETIASYRAAATAALGISGHIATDAETQAYASGLYATLKGQVTFTATPAVAFSLLNANGSLQNGTFVLTNTGILSYASQALTAANYGTFRNLLSNGTLSSGTFALTNAGIAAEASTVLTQDYQNFQNLNLYGSVQNGAFTLTAAGVTFFRQAASTVQNPNPTDAQVRAYANALYQGYAQTINTAENAQYQTLVQNVKASAASNYQYYANLVFDAYCGNSCTTDRATFLATTPVQYYAYLLNTNDRAALTSLLALGTVTNGVFTLTPTNVGTYAQTGLSSANFATYTGLLAAGTVANNALTLTPAGLAQFAQSPLTTTYQTYQSLTANGATQLGTYVFSNAGVQVFAQSGISAAYQHYQTLVGSGNSTIGASNTLTLTASGLTAYRPLAAGALGIANPTDDQVQAYANQQYQNSIFTSGNTTYQQYSQTVQAGAQTQLQSLLQIVRSYAASTENNPYCYSHCSTPTYTDETLVTTYAQQALSVANYAALQTLLGSGSFDQSTGVFTLSTTPSAVAAISPVVLLGADNLAFQTLLSRGSVANNQFIYSATGAVAAFQQLAGTGNFSNGVFQLSNANVVSAAQTALGFAATQKLISSGSVGNGSSLVLSDAGIIYYAPAALSVSNYAAFSGLIASGNGEVVAGVLTLTSNGISAFRTAATASVGHAASDAEVQTFARGQYQSFSASVQAYANGQYQSYVSTFQNVSSVQYQTYATQIRTYYDNAQGNNNGCYFGNCSSATPLADADLAAYMQSHLSDLGFNQTDLTTFNGLVTKGVVQNGVYSLTSAGIASSFADPVQVAAKAQTFQTVLNGGSLQNGTFVLNNNGIVSASRSLAIAADPATTSADILYTANHIQRVFNSQLIQLDNQSLVSDAQATAYLAWVQAAAAQTYSAGVQQIQGDAVAQYQNYVSPITVYGHGQYQSLLQTIQASAAGQYQAATRTIQAYGNSQYQGLTSNGTSPPPPTTQGVLDLIANSTYSDGQIVSALNRSALLPSPTTVGNNGNANIIGRNVNLITSASIGSLSPNVVVNLSDLRNGTVTADQQAAIAAASAPGSVTFDVLVNGLLRTGQVLSQIGTTLDPDSIVAAQLVQVSPVFVNASGIFNATASTSVYVQAASALSTSASQLLASADISTALPVASLALGRINAGGDVTIQAPQNIAAALTTSQTPVNAIQIVTPGNLTIAAGGSLGTAANALTFQIGGNLISGSAGADAYLKGVGGDIRVGRLSAGVNLAGGGVGGTASLTAPDGNILGYLPGVAVSATNIVLNAHGNVGSNANPFQIQDTSAGALSGTVTGTAWIYGSTQSNQATPVNLYVGNFSALAGVNIQADADIDINGAVTSGNGAVFVQSLRAISDIVMGSMSSIVAASTISLQGAADIVLGRLQTTNATSAGLTISVSAGGAITGNGDGQTNLISGAPTGSVLLAGASVGTIIQRVSISASRGAVEVSSGDIYLKAIGDTEATSLIATHGSIDLLGTGSLVLDSVRAGTATGATGTFTAGNAATSGSGITIGTAISSGAQTIHANGDVNFTSLVTTGASGDINAMSDQGKIAGGSVQAARSATLIAATTNQGNMLTATTGSATLRAGGLIDWSTLTAGTTLDATSTGAGITFGTATSGGVQTLQANNDIGFTLLQTTGVSGDINATSDEGKIAGGSVQAARSATLIAATTNQGNMLTATTGSATLRAGGLIDWSTLTAGTTLAATSTGAGITLGTATSGGAQTLQANNDIGFTLLQTTGVSGDINATSDQGKIAGGSVQAARSATLIAATTNQGNMLTATTGSATLRAGGLIDWSTLTAGTTLDATSTGAGITFGTATSGGSQTLQANNDIGFTLLQTTGASGDINAMSDEGKIAGGSVQAARSATLIAATTNQGNMLTATTGSATLRAGGLIDWSTLTAGTTLAATSTGAGITLGTATSGGTQMLQANNDIFFSQLTTTGLGSNRGDIIARSLFGRILGGSIAAHGNLDLFANGIIFDSVSSGADATLRSTADVTGHAASAIRDIVIAAGFAPGTTGAIAIDTTSGATVSLSATGALRIGNIVVATGLALAASDITATITHNAGPGAPPLMLDITGARGRIANAIVLNLIAPSVEFTRLATIDGAVTTNGAGVKIGNGYVLGRLAIATPIQFVLMDNRSPTPSGSSNVQLFQPAFGFDLNLQANALSTNSFVVDYKAGSNVTDYLGGVPYDGASLVRDFARTDRLGAGFAPQLSGDSARSTLFVTGTSPDTYISIQAPKKDVETVGSGPAVNVGQ